MSGTGPVSVEEQRLGNRLPRDGDPGRAQEKAFGEQMIEGGGFGQFAPGFARELCRVGGIRAARGVVERAGERLWRRAVDRAQGRGGGGTLPAGDDRPLYWTRLQARVVLRHWTPRFAIGEAQREALIGAFDRASRGMDDIRYPGGNVKRVLVSGFDPYTLDGGVTGPAPGTVGNNIRHGNPSGATALALDGTRYRRPDGRIAVIQAYLLPVNYTEFAAGYLEDAVGPVMRKLDASVTISQAVDSEFWLEQWNGRYHGVSPGNDKSQPCPTVDGKPQLAVDNHACDTQVVRRWGGPSAFDLRNPPQWTATTLPIKQMIEAGTGRSVPRPPGDQWPDPSVAFGVIWHTSYTEFPDCAKAAVVTRNTPVPGDYPPPTAPVPPDPDSCAYSGGGGNYLSNESAYRNTLLRDRFGRHIPAGHIHTPDMQHFDSPFAVSDATFDAWRTSIVAQTRNLVHVVASQ
ncbi:hypothetical protein [Actinomadura gamaensis]|uniref:Uncharacterized protein n=1 Tax=Actinomadura gamaensis TaxID=1763541 RepID=A0ABV9U035_9ACTN